MDADSANAAYFDQLLALEWVQENIVYFGGDSSSVTLFGQSAGAMSIAIHMVAPPSSLLFHRFAQLSLVQRTSTYLFIYYVHRSRCVI